MYSNQELIELVDIIRSEGTETEWLEFKSNHVSNQDIGEYISALSNGAALWGRPYSYLMRQQLNEYYEGLDSEEKTCAKLRLRIMKAKEKNRKRANTISTLSEKYPTATRTDEIAALIRSNEINIDKANRDIEMWEERIRSIKGQTN